MKCFHSNKFWKFDVEDNAFLIFKNNKNQLANLHSSSTLWRHTFRMDITLEKGYILVEGFYPKQEVMDKRKLPMQRGNLKMKVRQLAIHQKL